MTLSKNQNPASPATDEPATEDSSLAAVYCATEAAIDKKAENVKILDIRELNGFTDHFLLCNGTSDRQVQAISDSVQAAMKKAGHRPLSIEGYAEGRWILMDYGDIVVHVFLDALRDYYHLESLWEDAKSVEIPARFFEPAASPLS